jgi:hypothetical protein
VDAPEPKKYDRKLLSMPITVSNLVEKNFTDSLPIKPPEPVIMHILPMSFFVIKNKEN